MLRHAVIAVTRTFYNGELDISPRNVAFSLMRPYRRLSRPPAGSGGVEWA